MAVGGRGTPGVNPSLGTFLAFGGRGARGANPTLGTFLVVGGQGAFLVVGSQGALLAFGGRGAILVVGALGANPSSQTFRQPADRSTSLACQGYLRRAQGCFWGMMCQTLIMNYQYLCT